MHYGTFCSISNQTLQWLIDASTPLICDTYYVADDSDLNNQRGHRHDRKSNETKR